MVRKHAPYWKYSVFWRSGGEQFLWCTAAAILNHHNNYLILPLLDHKSHILERRAGKVSTGLIAVYVFKDAAKQHGNERSKMASDNSEGRGENEILIQVSRITSAGFLSSRIPMKVQ
jgi:hypothetical protein